MRILALGLIVVGLVGCSSSSDGPGDTVPGPPRSEVMKGSQPPSGGAPAAATK